MLGVCTSWFVPIPFQKFSCKIAAMNPDHIEKHNAICVVRLARELAQQRSNPCDHIAAAVAVLVRAVELATPDLSNDVRAGLFTTLPAMTDPVRIDGL
jgi:NTP pyrophosphatase (non-canonical NTP hydrolase)